MTLKMAVLAPMPSASVSRTTVVRPGVFRKERTAYRKSESIVFSPSDRANRPRGLFSNAGVGVFECGQQPGKRSCIADPAERPGRLLTHGVALLRQRPAER